MSEYLKKEIMEQSRHHMIYGYDTPSRSDFINFLESSYPVVSDRDEPIAIKMVDYDLPKIEMVDFVDKFRVQQISREYFNLSMMKNIIKRIIDDGVLDGERLEKFLNQLSSITSDDSSYSSLDDFYKDLNDSLLFYLDGYKKMFSDSAFSLDFRNVKVPFVMPGMIVPKVKKMLNNGSYFGIIIDKHDDLSLNAVRMVNGYLSKRINSDISMKVFCEPDKWPTYYDMTGMLVEATHDYGVVEIDNSYSEYTKKLMKRYEIK